MPKQVSKWHKARDGTQIRTIIEVGPRGGKEYFTEVKRAGEKRRIRW